MAKSELIGSNYLRIRLYLKIHWSDRLLFEWFPRSIGATRLLFRNNKFKFRSRYDYVTKNVACLPAVNLPILNFHCFY